MKRTIGILALSFLGSLAFAANHDITQLDKKFDKTEITIAPGDTLKIHNKEKDITHNVYSLGPKNAFELKTQEPGSTSDVIFKEEGETDVECAIHPGMKLKVKVKK